ncbi:MAG TPA: AsmA-like C-terminal region-containing protein [Lacipirellulaceae bacterium]|nr:AsmA-like C-terminal region-containing protein [Lacipirellulaceae bacterium]
MDARTTSIFTQLINLCWSLCKWCLLLTFVGALAVGGYLYFKLDDEIRRQVEVLVGNHYRDFKVRVGSARFDPDRGIAIDNLSLTPKSAEGGMEEPILTIGEMYLAGELRIEQLLTNQMHISDIVIRHAKLRAIRSADGQWNSAALLPLPHFSDDTPRVSIEDAGATIECTSAGSAKPWSLQGINLQLVPLPLAAGQPSAKAHFQIEGTTSGLPAREFRLTGQIGGDGLLDVTAMATGIDISPALVTKLPPSVAAHLAGADFSGQGDVELRLKRADSISKLDWSAAFKVDRGRLNHLALPDPLTEVSLEGSANAERLSIKRMDAKCGQASVTLALNRAGWAANAPVAISMKVLGFQLSERLQTALPESQARIWQRFRPIGSTDADVRLTFDGKKWKPQVTATCRGISLTDADKFPYVVEQTTGQVNYQPSSDHGPDQLHLDLTGLGGGRPIKIAADLTHLAADDAQGPEIGEGVAREESFNNEVGHTAGYRGVRYARGSAAGHAHPVGYIEVSGSDIPLHEQLIDALPAKAKDLVRSLQGEGAIDFRFRAEWKEESQREANRTLDIRLKDCRIRFAPFPFPLQHVQGLVTERNSQWSLNDVEARGNNDSTIVKCRGGVIPHDSGCEADLTIDATNVPLDDSLKQVLTPPVSDASSKDSGGPANSLVGSMTASWAKKLSACQQAWSQLNPRGSIDLSAHLTRQPNELDPSVEITLRPCERTVSIEPNSYRLENLKGVATYKRGQVEWHGVSAEHDRSIYSVESGVWQVTPDGGWQCAVSNANVDRLTISRELLAALPPGAQSLVDKLQPNGSIGLYNGNFQFAKMPPAGSITSTWDVSLECQQASIQGAVPLQSINGGIRLIGQSDARGTFASGELALDSVSCKDIQLTNLHGPFWADASRCLIGEPACQQLQQQPRRLVADAYGGTLATNIEFVHDANPAYKIDVHLGGANLGRFARERLGGPTEMNGTLSGTLAVSGTGTSMQTLRGGGELHVVDGNIYQLPLLVGMLKVLSNRTPDSTAFNRCDMQFAIQGEHIHFQHLNLLGDAVSLYGNGETDINRKLDLVFYTLIGPADWPIPFVKTIVGHVSQQVLQLKVVGTLDDPKIEKKAVPAASDMIAQIQSEIHDGAATMTPSTASREAKTTTQ